MVFMASYDEDYGAEYDSMEYNAGDYTSTSGEW